MDPSKKRRIDDNGVPLSDLSDQGASLTPDESRKLIENLTKEQLLDLLQEAILRHSDVLASIRSIADADTTQRKLFIRGLGWETTTDGLRTLFSAYGEIEEAVVIMDKGTGKSKGYGFVTFKHVDGAILALREPSKKIDGRVTVTQLAAAGNTASRVTSSDVANRKIYVREVPVDMPSDKLLSHFALYGEIEEGPLGFDKVTGKSRGYALFVYKTVEGAQAALVDPVKMIDGKQVTCKLAQDGKNKPGAGGQSGPGGMQGPQGGPVDGHFDGAGMGPPNSMPGQYGPGMGSYTGFSGVQGQQPLNHMGSTGMGGPGLTSMGGQAPTSMGAGGYGAGPYSGGYAGHGSTGYGNHGAPTGGHVGSTGGMAGVGGGMGGAGGGLGGSGGGMGGGGMGGSGSFYRPSGGYPDNAHYGMPASTGYPTQHHQPTGNSPAPRGMYPNVPPYY